MSPDEYRALGECLLNLRELIGLERKLFGRVSPHVVQAYLDAKAEAEMKIAIDDARVRR